MKKIVFVITKSEVGGAQTWVHQLKELLISHYDIYLITSSSGWLCDKFEPDHVTVIPELSSLTKPWAAIKIAWRVKEIGADVVISSSANAGIYARLAKLLYNHRSIYVSHGWSCIYNGGRAERLLCGIEKYFSTFTDVVLCVSESDKVKAVNKIGIDDDKIAVIRNAISPLPLKEGVNPKIRILSVGRMVYPKRPDLICHVISRMPDVDIDFIGDGPYLSELKAKFASSSNISFKGEIGGFQDFLNYDIFLLCSDSEGLPMSAIEAASAGVPLLMSDVGGCYELIHSGSNGCHNGELFSNDEDALRGKLQKMIDNYQSYYLSAIENKALFDISQIKEQYIKIIEG